MPALPIHIMVPITYPVALSPLGGAAQRWACGETPKAPSERAGRALWFGAVFSTPPWGFWTGALSQECPSQQSRPWDAQSTAAFIRLFREQDLTRPLNPNTDV